MGVSEGLVFDVIDHEKSQGNFRFMKDLGSNLSLIGISDSMFLLEGIEGSFLIVPKLDKQTLRYTGYDMIRIAVSVQGIKLGKYFLLGLTTLKSSGMSLDNQIITNFLADVDGNVYLIDNNFVDIDPKGFYDFILSGSEIKQVQVLNTKLDGSMNYMTLRVIEFTSGKVMVLGETESTYRDNKVLSLLFSSQGECPSTFIFDGFDIDNHSLRIGNGAGSTHVSINVLKNTKKI